MIFFKILKTELKIKKSKTKIMMGGGLAIEIHDEKESDSISNNKENNQNKYNNGYQVNM